MRQHAVRLRHADCCPACCTAIERAGCNLQLSTNYNTSTFYKLSLCSEISIFERCNEPLHSLQQLDCIQPHVCLNRF